MKQLNILLMIVILALCGNFYLDFKNMQLTNANFEANMIQRRQIILQAEAGISLALAGKAMNNKIMSLAILTSIQGAKEDSTDWIMIGK